MLRYILATLLLVSASQAAGPTLNPFEAGWRFLKGDAAGAEQPAFNDASWRSVDLPHDWSIEGPFDEKNPTGAAGAFLPAGVGWYRKHFRVPKEQAKNRVFIEFDGVMANSDVWINGRHLGKRPYGYASFEYELTEALNSAGDNVIAVKADNSGQPASRWYTGAGIYRHVQLRYANAIHLEQCSTFVTTPKIGQVHVAASIVNQSGAPRTVTVEVSILSPAGALVANIAPQTIVLNGTAAFEGQTSIQAPELWALDHPALYRAVVRVRDGKNLLDEDPVPFGIREFHFDAATGFWLNARNFKIKGVALHHDAGALGAAVPLRAWERRLEQLKQIGVNAIRTAHNPAAPEFLDLCDRMGFLVMDEMFDCWTVAKNPYDYHLYFREWSSIDTRDTVRRDRNHPSIIIFSAGNEIHDTPKADLAKEILAGLIDVFHRNDPTRPVTQALFRPNVSHDYDNGLADMLDVIGQNYRENEILAAHAAKPERKILGTENQQGRGVWLALRDNPAYSGQFLWSGADYLGEAGKWPAIDSSFGLLDRTGARKPVSYERQSWWSEKPMVYMVRRVAARERGAVDPGYEAEPVRGVQTLFPDWTPANQSAHDETVEVYSNAPDVELLLNGKSLGTKPLPQNASPRVWRVPFAPGTIQAIARNNGQTVARNELRTAGQPAKIVLSTDRNSLTADWNDLAYITATVADEHGTVVPDASHVITYKLTGPGAIVAVDNADHTSHEPFQASQRHAFQGQCIAIVKATGATGPIALSASSPGLAPATITMRSASRASR